MLEINSTDWYTAYGTMMMLDGDIDGKLRESGVRLNFGCHDRLRLKSASVQSVSGGTNYFVTVDLLCDPADQYAAVYFFVPTYVPILIMGAPVPPQPELQAIKYPVALDDELVLFKDDAISGTMAATMYGGGQDEYGCYTSAGYTYCSSTGKCQRFWEEPCAEGLTASTGLLGSTLGGDRDENGCILTAGYIWCDGERNVIDRGRSRALNWIHRPSRHSA